MNCLIVDDDACARIDLEQKVSKVSFLNLVGSSDSAVGAMEVLLREKVDLVLLDVMMPGTNGFEFLEGLRPKKTQVILVSSDSNYAVDAFDYSVLDFLVKPVKEERFLRAIMRARSQFSPSPSQKESVKQDHLFVRSNQSHIRIPTESIFYIEAQSDHLNVVTETGDFKVNTTMKSILESIPPGDFLRVHNSFIVNLHRISSVEGNMIEIRKKIIPVSRSRFKEFMGRINLV